MQSESSDFHDQLVRGLAHRMNNILSLFHGYLGLLTDDRKLDPVLREGLNRIREGAHAATELIERTSAISRPASCIRRELRFSDFLRQLGPTFESLRAPNIDIAIECSGDLPPVRVEPSRLKLAIIELVRNACEAAKSRVLIRVTSSEPALQRELFPGHSATPAERWVRIEVIDDGPGVPASEAGRIFEPFFSTKKEEQRAGLGLAVALGCARQFGGGLQHRGRKGGTTFEMTLPACVPEHLSAVA
jgi:signal transduction histidine kinase